MKFQKSWRVYQSRLLKQLDQYLLNKRFHLVAAPGSGKTVLGIEVVRRINQRTLVLAPTITIRDQWIDRLIELFLPAGSHRPEWISISLKNPASITVATYQALHAACCGGPEDTLPPTKEIEVISHSLEGHVSDDDEDHSARSRLGVPAFLSEANFRTIVLDEAHHLRAEWWKVLTSFVASMQDPTVVSLTATPPYDVSPLEWQRYQELCGPVDAEVSVPEMVQEGNLCPHQDYVYFSPPAQREQKLISDFRISVDQFIVRLQANVEFRDAILKHPWVLRPAEHTEQILDDPEYLSSMVIFLHEVGEKIPSDLLKILGLSKRRIPGLQLDWLEVLLSHCLYSDAENFRRIEPTLKSTRHELLAMGAIERRRVKLRDPSDYLKLLTTSVTKLKSIEEIVRLEAGALGDNLRCVILTDFIRKTELPKSPDDARIFEDIGVVPVFESLRQAGIRDTRVGVLSGSLVIVPSSAEIILRQSAAKLGMDDHDLSISPLPHDSAFLVVDIHAGYHRGPVSLITAVFESGAITVLIGTKSLLGEGWDAPCINTLVLASFVGSFVLSNQMRGRAIRVDPAQPKKTANVWHLVCVEPGIFGPGDDYQLLVRRCSAFVGVSTTANVIENGTERLGLGHPPYTREQLVQLNAATSNRALDRDGLRQRWQDSLNAGLAKRMTDGLETPSEVLPRDFVLANTIAALLMQAAYIALMIIYTFGRSLGRVRPENLVSVTVFVLGLAAVASLPWSLLALWRFIRHGTPERSIKQIGAAVLESLEYAGLIDQGAEQFRVYADRNQDGTVYCWLGGGTGAEQAVFLRALRESLTPIENPRYLLARRKIWRLFREDYFAVPDALARKKEFAEQFARRWSSRVGPVQLVFTRTPEGRRLLLRARTHSLSGAFQKRAERLSCWK